VKAWERLIVPTLCGGCGRELDAGDPVLVISRARGTAKPLRFVRCDRCEGPAPPDLPPLVVRGNAITPTPLRRLAPLLPLGTPLADFRARASGEREPGEEG
jgi:hypothetical protein